MLWHCSDEESDDVSNEVLCGQEVSKVDGVLTSLHNDEVSKLGNSAVHSQGREMPKWYFFMGTTFPV